MHWQDLSDYIPAVIVIAAVVFFAWRVRRARTPAARRRLNEATWFWPF